MGLLAESLLRSVRHKKSERTVAPRSCLEVEAVAPESTAALAGIVAGDLLETVNGSSAAEHGGECFGLADDERCYGFASLARGERTTLVTNGFPLGVKLVPTVAAIHARFDARQPDFDDLRRLYEAGRTDVLAELTRSLVGDGIAMAAKGVQKDRNTPALALRAAALYAQGKKSDGLLLAREYLEKFAENWTQDFMALALECLGLDLLERGDASRAAELLREAFVRYPCDAIAKSVERADGARPPKPVRWEGQAFPVSYTLPSLLAKGKPVALAGALRALAPGRLLTICLLATYRSNGPYNEFMGRFRRLRRATKGMLGALHVLTMEPERRADRAYWHKEEDAALAEGVEMDILFDPEGGVTIPANPPGSPEILIVTAKGVVAAEGDLDEFMAWKGIAASAPQSARPLAAK